MTLVLIFFLMVAVGIPIAYAFGISGVLYIAFFTNLNPQLIMSTTFTAVNSFTLLAMPFFIFAGDIMRLGGVSSRLLNFAKLLFRKSKSALGTITIVASAFFGAISGSSNATVAAIGGIMIPEMHRDGYKLEYAAALASTAGYLGILIPPSVPLVVYAVSSGQSVGKLFVATIIPGILAAIIMIVLNMFLVQHNYRPAKHEEAATENSKSAGRVVLEALPALLMPVVILGGIYGGIFTATEAAAVAIVYGIVVSVFVYRDIKLKDILRIAKDSALTSASLLIIISLAGFFGNLLTMARVPAQISSAILSISDSKFGIMLMINLLLLLLGMIMDATTAILITTPILLPIASAAGISPIHFGIIMLVNFAIGVITPPMALNLFVGSKVSGVPIAKMVKPLIPFLLASLGLLILVVLCPPLSMWLPSLMKK